MTMVPNNFFLLLFLFVPFIEKLKLLESGGLGLDSKRSFLREKVLVMDFMSLSHSLI